MNRINKHKNDCCGCTACAGICAYGAIKMKSDSLGFQYPEVDDDKCVDCGLCAKVCQFKKSYEAFDVEAPEIFAFRNIDETQLLRSQSGAAFWTIAQQFIKEGGVVYGCGFDSDFKVIHKRVHTLDDLEDLRGSKYVQSDVCDTFIEAKDDLKKGIKVLYSGTSCQIANLKSFVGPKQRENLYTIDIVCHGVPSPYVYRDYLDSLRKNNRQPLTRVNFRDKAKGWNTHIPSFQFGGKIQYRSDYARYFYSHIMLRECCYECPYTNFRRVSDISIADFWGWNKVNDTFNDNKGVSLLLVNSIKGKSMLSSVSSISHTIPVLDKKLCMQRNLECPTSRNPLRSVFEDDYAKYGYHYVAKEYLGTGVRDTIIRYCKTLIKKLLMR